VKDGVVRARRTVRLSDCAELPVGVKLTVTRRRTELRWSLLTVDELSLQPIRTVRALVTETEVRQAGADARTWLPRAPTRMPL
jgi:uncharacterized protein (DUF2384 family)